MIPALYCFHVDQLSFEVNLDLLNCFIASAINLSIEVHKLLFYLMSPFHYVICDSLVLVLISLLLPNKAWHSDASIESHRPLDQITLYVIDLQLESFLNWPDIFLGPILSNILFHIVFELILYISINILKLFQHVMFKLFVVISLFAGSFVHVGAHSVDLVESIVHNFLLFIFFLMLSFTHIFELSCYVFCSSFDLFMGIKP